MSLDRTATAPAPWRWQTLMAAPHRLAFFSAAVVMSAAALWWAHELVGRATGWFAPSAAVPNTFVHALVMSLGFMPLFFCGFLFTAGPKWLQMPEVTAPQVRGPVTALTVGWLAVLAGGHLHHLLAAAGALVATVGWSLLTWRFWALVRHSKARDRVHAKVIAVASSLGAVWMLLGALGLGSMHLEWVRWAALAGLWLFIAPVYVTVAHRMIPFFTASALPVLDAWRPFWLLWSLLAALGLQGLWLVLDTLGWSTTPGVASVRVLTSALTGLGVLALAIRWGLVQSLKVRLLAMLHLGFVWLGVALCLDALAVVLHFAGQPAVVLLPLHALTMGFLGSVLIAMATRVSCGHGGRTLAADDLAWALFWVLQGAVLLRLVAVVWTEGAPWVLVAASVAWLAAVGGWSVRYGRWFGRPRLDGRPG